MVVSYLLLAGVVCAFCGCVSWLLAYYRRRPKVTPEQLSEARKQKELMTALVAMPGWKYLAQVAEAQAQIRSNKVLLVPTENAYQQEYMKGEVQGIKVLMNIPQDLIKQAEDILALEPAEEQDED